VRIHKNLISTGTSERTAERRQLPRKSQMMHTLTPLAMV
jgi:hypothetical protein